MKKLILLNYIISINRKIFGFYLSTVMEDVEFLKTLFSYFEINVVVYYLFIISHGFVFGEISNIL